MNPRFHYVYLIGFAFNVSYLMLAFAIPLDAVVHHLPIGAIALLTALPGVLLLTQRFLSGPLTDVLGEVPVLRLSILLGVLAGLAPFVLPGAITGLVISQIFNGSMRGLFWTSAQSYLTGFSDDGGRALGHFNAAGTAGGIVGIMATGLLVQSIGYPLLFLATVAIQIIALILTLLLRARPLRHDPVRMLTAVRRMPDLLRLRIMWIAGGMALFAAIPQALVQSFYPIYFVTLDHSAAAASILTTLRNVGMLAGNFIAGDFFLRIGRSHGIAISLLGLSIGLFITGNLLPNVPWIIWVGLTLTGFFGALVNIYYLTVVVRAVGRERRASAIAMVNLYWSGSMFATPLVFGAMTGLAGMAGSFRIIGIVVLLGSIPLCMSPVVRNDGRIRETEEDA